MDTTHIDPTGALQPTAPPAERAAGPGWAIVPHNTTAAFQVRNFGVHTVHGVVPVVSATVTAAGLHRVDGVRMVLDLAAIDTAHHRRDKDLRGRRLLDTDHFPELVFESTAVTGSLDAWEAEGALSAKGTSTPVTVTVERVSGPVNDHVTVRATTSFDRRELGIRAPRFLVGHRIEVEVTAQFRAVHDGQ
jgi:polyisoprenoid-binding protein YceI